MKQHFKDIHTIEKFFEKISSKKISSEKTEGNEILKAEKIEPKFKNSKLNQNIKALQSIVKNFNKLNHKEIQDEIEGNEILKPEKVESNLRNFKKFSPKELLVQYLPLVF